MNLNNKNNLTFGCGYDFRLYCVGEKEIDQELLCSEKLHCRTTPYSGIGSFAFPFCDSFGVFCDFVSTADECGGTVFLHEASEQTAPCFTIPWRTEEEQNDIKRMIVDKDYKDALVQAVYAVLDKSPVRKVYLQVRCQCLEKENIIGMLTGRQIEALIREDKLFCNVVYVIYDYKATNG